VTQLRSISPTLKATQLTECKFQVADESNSISAPDFENTLTVGTLDQFRYHSVAVSDRLMIEKTACLTGVQCLLNATEQYRRKPRSPVITAEAGERDTRLMESLRRPRASGSEHEDQEAG
jgi:hypothetical protein